MPWDHGEWVVRREVPRGRPWRGTVVWIVEDPDPLRLPELPDGSERAEPDR